MKPIRFLILDDHQIILDGLKTMLSKEKNISICGACISGIDALKNALVNKPDIIITDWMMPDMSGLDFIRNLKTYKIQSKILVLSMAVSSNVIHDAIEEGANGFIMKQNATRDEIMKAITHLSENKDYFPSEVLYALNSKTKPQAMHHDVSFDNFDISVLSKSELQILQLFADGFTNKEISEKLSVNTRTIEKHKGNIKVKLNLKSNVDMIKFAIKNNICTL
jgi:DNA-binding NarL/FixJ family response regulator